jgi:hypothetical protein
MNILESKQLRILAAGEGGALVGKALYGLTTLALLSYSAATSPSEIVNKISRHHISPDSLVGTMTSFFEFLQVLLHFGLHDFPKLPVHLAVPLVGGLFIPLYFGPRILAYLLAWRKLGRD